VKLLIDDETLSGKLASGVLLVSLLVIGVIPSPFIKIILPGAHQAVIQSEVSPGTEKSAHHV